MINSNFFFCLFVLICDIEKMYGRGVTLHVHLVLLFTVLCIILNLKDIA